MRRVFKQACGIGFESAIMSGGLPRKFGLNLGLDINRDRRGVSLSRVNLLSYCPLTLPRDRKTSNTLLPIFPSDKMFHFSSQSPQQLKQPAPSPVSNPL